MILAVAQSPILLDRRPNRRGPQCGACSLHGENLFNVTGLAAYQLFTNGPHFVTLQFEVGDPNLDASSGLRTLKLLSHA